MMTTHTDRAERPRWLNLTCIALLALACPATLRADANGTENHADAQLAQVQAVEPPQYMRFSDDGHGGGKLQTAVVSFRNDAGQTVRLVGAIHIGEKSYYEQLNNDFLHDDAVLYELVKPRDAATPQRGAAPAPGAGQNPIGQMQHLMKDVLNLSFQLDEIDYTRPNFVHADLDKETFEKLQEERGETFEALIMKQLMKAFMHPADSDGDQPGAAAKKPDEAPHAPGDDTAGDPADETDKMLRQVIHLVTRPDMERQVKVLVARQLTDLQNNGKSIEAFGGPQSVLIGERNKAALKVLADQLAQHRQTISVFYGAAHMPDMASHLREMGFKPIACEWKSAWDLTLRPDQPSAVENLLMQLLKGLDDDQ